MVTAALVVLASKYLLAQAVIDTDSVLAAAEAARGNKPASAGEAAALNAYVAVTAWMSQHFAASTSLLLPFEAAAFRIAFHRFGNLNYPEWLVITAFLTVQTFVVWTVVMVLQRWIPHPELWLLGLSTLYGIFSLVQFFQGRPRWKSGLRATMGFAILFVASAILTQLMVMVVVALSMHG